MICSGLYPFFGIFIPLLRYYIWYRFRGAGHIFEVKKQQDIDDDTLSIGMFHRWNNLGKLIKPLAFNVSFKDNGTTITRTDVEDVPDFLPETSLANQIKEYLKDVEMVTTRDIADELSKPYDSVRTTLYKMKSRGEPLVYLEKKWGLSKIVEQL